MVEKNAFFHFSRLVQPCNFEMEFVALLRKQLEHLSEADKAKAFVALMSEFAPRSSPSASAAVAVAPIGGNYLMTHNAEPV